MDKTYIDGIWNPNRHICHNIENCPYMKEVYAANVELGKALVGMIKEIEHPYKNIDYYKIPISDDGEYIYPQLSEMALLIKNWAVENESDFIMKELTSELKKYEKALDAAEANFKKKHDVNSIFQFKTEKSIFNTVDIGEQTFHLLRKVVECPAYE